MNEDGIIVSGGWATRTGGSGLWGAPDGVDWSTATVSTHVPPPKPEPKTAKEFAELDTENMSKEELIKVLNGALVALEESEEAWTEEHEKRIEAEQTVRNLREAGFTGGEPAPKEEEEEEEYLGTVIPNAVAPRGGISYTQADIDKIRDRIAKALRETGW